MAQKFGAFNLINYFTIYLTINLLIIIYLIIIIYL